MDPIEVKNVVIINIDKFPWTHNSKHLPLYSPFHSNLNVFAKLILPGIVSIIIPQE